MRRNYVDELSVACDIIKNACSKYFDFSSNSISIIKEPTMDLVQSMILGLKNAFPGDVVVTQLTKDETFASHRTWTIEFFGPNKHIDHNSKLFGIQVGLVEGKDIILSIIYIPFLDEIYTATLGGGAYLNQVQINCAKISPLETAVIGFGNFNMLDEEGSALQIEMMKNIRYDVDEVYMLGSNALSFAAVASGRMNGYVSFDTAISAINPGILLCQEAGAFISTIDGNQFTYESNNIVVASTTDILAEIKQSQIGPTRKGERVDNRIHIGYLGIPGDLCEAAANAIANRQEYRYVDFIPCSDEKQLVRELQIKRIDYAVVPITTEDHHLYREVSEALSRIRFEVVDTVTLPLQLNLYKRTKDIPNGSIKTVVTDENYYSYVDTALRLLMPSVERKSCPNASIAAKSLRDDEFNDETAVLCTKESGDFARLCLIREELVGDPDASVTFRMVSHVF